jgi:NAD(P)-dependent dehydrogenase (short-subunit alcohol dehydrogenase family)
MKLEQGRVAVVTGAASGLGLALAEALAARRLDLVLSDVETGALADAVKAVGASGASVIGVPADVRSADQVEALAAATLDRFGRVDVVCNNAGVTSHPTPAWEVERNDWEWVLSVNLGGVINGIRAFVPHLIAQNSGHIVNTASMAGISVAPGLGPYLASKHAVVALSEGLAQELALAAPGVGVTVVCPGMVTTNIHAAERNRPVDLGVADRRLGEAELSALIQWTTSISGEDMPASAAAGIVVRAIESGLLHVAPNGLSAGVRAWTDRLLADLDPS